MKRRAGGRAAEAEAEAGERGVGKATDIRHDRGRDLNRDRDRDRDRGRDPDCGRDHHRNRDTVPVTGAEAVDE